MSDNVLDEWSAGMLNQIYSIKEYCRGERSDEIEGQDDKSIEVVEAIEAYDTNERVNDGESINPELAEMIQEENLNNYSPQAMRRAFLGHFNNPKKGKNLLEGEWVEIENSDIEVYRYIRLNDGREGRFGCLAFDVTGLDLDNLKFPRANFIVSDGKVTHALWMLNNTLPAKKLNKGNPRSERSDRCLNDKIKLMEIVFESDLLEECCLNPFCSFNVVRRLRDKGYKLEQLSDLSEDERAKRRADNKIRQAERMNKVNEGQKKKTWQKLAEGFTELVRLDLPYTVKDLARYAGVCDKTVRNYRNEPPFIKLLEKYESAMEEKEFMKDNPGMCQVGAFREEDFDSVQEFWEAKYNH